MLSTSCRYGMMVCGCLAETGHHNYVTVAKMGRDLGIAPYVLAKVVQRLTRAGILESLRGPHGGARLARTAEKMPLRRLTAAFDDLTWLEECPFQIAGIQRSSSCVMHDSWEVVRSSIRTFIDETTIGDLKSPPRSSPTGDIFT